jgi:hypothetical protein
VVTTMIDHAPADLWIVPLGTKCLVRDFGGIKIVVREKRRIP